MINYVMMDIVLTAAVTQLWILSSTALVLHLFPLHRLTQARDQLSGLREVSVNIDRKYSTNRKITHLMMVMETTSHHPVTDAFPISALSLYS